MRWLGHRRGQIDMDGGETICKQKYDESNQAVSNQAVSNQSVWNQAMSNPAIYSRMVQSTRRHHQCKVRHQAWK